MSDEELWEPTPIEPEFEEPEFDFDDAGDPELGHIDLDEELEEEPSE